VALAVAVGVVVALSHHGRSSPGTGRPTPTVPVRPAGSGVSIAGGVVAAPTVPSTVPPGPLRSFGDGTYLVGRQVLPGTYVAPGGSNCYWARLSGLSGDLNDTITNDNALGQAIVTVQPGDRAFQTEGCGTWRPLGSSGPRATTFGDGTWAVGIDIAPGTYHAPGGSLCYWERDSTFGGGMGSILANNNATGAVVVTIAPTDRAFETSGCGVWRPGA
jgi:hypothetical protein